MDFESYSELLRLYNIETMTTSLSISICLIFNNKNFEKIPKIKISKQNIKLEYKIN